MLGDWEDEFLGLLQWDTTFGEWQGQVDFPRHGEVGVGLPLEYRDSREMQTHIQATFRIIERDEPAFRERAARELFDNGGYVLFWPEGKLYKPDEFAREMHLGLITFEPEFPDMSLRLGYEYGEGVEHGITIFLTWDGTYKSAR